MLHYLSWDYWPQYFIGGILAISVLRDFVFNGKPYDDPELTHNAIRSFKRTTFLAVVLHFGGFW